MTKIIELDDDNFDTLIKYHGVVMVSFWANWSAPCKLMRPILDELANELADDVIVAEYDIDKETTISNRYNVDSVPMILIFLAGEVIETIVGVRQKKQIMSVINKYFE